MGKLAEEVRIRNTPISDAYRLWRFTQGYCNGHPNGEAPVGILHFIAVAILTNERLLEPVSNKRDSLQSYIRSFEDKKDADILLTIHERIKAKREHTLKAIDIAIAHGLLIWDTNSGKLYPCNLEKSPRRGKNLKPRIKKEGDKAEILGKWFSKHEVSTIATYLKVIL